MKYLATLLLIISFTGIAVLGPTLLGMGASHSGGCLSASVDGTVCPATLVGFSIHHLTILQTLSSAEVSPVSSTILFLAAILLAVISVFLLHKKLRDPDVNLSLRRLRELDLGFSVGLRKMVSWLSLLKLSPTI